MDITWHIFHVRKRTPFYVAMYTPAIAYGRRRVLGFNYHAKLFHINGMVAMRQSEFDTRRKEIHTRTDRDPDFLLAFLSEHYRYYVSQSKKLWAMMENMHWEKETNRSLARWLTRYTDSIGDFWATGVAPLFAEQDFTESIGALCAARLSPSESAEAMQVFLSPKKEGIVGEEYRSFLHCATLPASRRDVALANHHKQFAWTANQLYTHSFFPLSYYRRRLKTLLHRNPKKLLQKYDDERRKHRRSFAYWMRRVHPDRRERLMIESLNEAIFYRSWRGEKPYESQWRLVALFEEIAKRLNSTAKQLLFCLPQELVQWLNGGKHVPFVVIRARQRGFVYLPTRHGRVLTGSAVQQWERRLATKIVGALEVKGSVAFPGVVRGSARLVRSAEDLRKVKKGDILVTPSTTPLYMPILGKVKAIVTEEGGVLSHASVISREMKIPCIIGTKTATHLFKDGDRVEVDGGKGIVRRIDRDMRKNYN